MSNQSFEAKIAKIIAKNSQVLKPWEEIELMI